jgi:hypothetical protein
VYAVDADTDSIFEADHPVESDSPEDEVTKQIVADGFKAYPAAIAFILTCMNSKTGEHTMLHAYKRPAATEAQI